MTSAGYKIYCESRKDHTQYIGRSKIAEAHDCPSLKVNITAYVKGVGLQANMWFFVVQGKLRMVPGSACRLRNLSDREHYRIIQRVYDVFVWLAHLNRLNF